MKIVVTKIGANGILNWREIHGFKPAKITAKHSIARCLMRILMSFNYFIVTIQIIRYILHDIEWVNIIISGPGEIWQNDSTIMSHLLLLLESGHIETAQCIIGAISP